MTYLPCQTIHRMSSDRIAPSLVEEVFRLYDRAMAATSTGIVIADATQPDMPIAYCNPAFERITGYSREEVIGQNCRFLQGRETDRAAVEEIRSAVREERECSVILKNYRKDGTPFWNELTISPVRDGNGEVTHFMGVQTDISDRKEAEEALLQTEAKYRSIFENATEGIFQTSSDGRFLSANPALAKMYGYDSPADLMLKLNNIQRQLYVDRNRRSEFISQIQEKGVLSEFESAIYRQDGSIIWISENTREVRNPRGELLYYEGTVVDITKRKQAEADLRNQEYWLNTLIDAVPDIVILKDGQGRWVVANNYALKLFGLERVDYRGQTSTNLVKYTRESVREMLLASQESDESTWQLATLTYSTENIDRPTGGTNIFDVRKVPLFNPDGSRKGLVVVGRDITSHIHAQEALGDSEKRFRAIFERAAIGMTLAKLSGELVATNPALQAMLGYTEVELAEMSLTQLTHPDDVECDREYARELLAGDRDSYQSQKRYLRKDGSTIWGRLSVSAIHSSQGDPQFILGMLEDVTERIEAQQALSQNEAKWRSLIQNSSDIITLLDADGTILYESPSIKVLGYTPEELIGHAAFEFVHPDDLPQVISGFGLLSSSVETKDPTEFRLRRADGSWCFLEAVATNLLADPTVGAIIVNSRDITTRKQAETRLEKINECFLGFGSDAVENIDRLTALAGELLGGTCALYNRLEDGLLWSVGKWQAPSSLQPSDRPEGHICYDVIQRGGDRAFVVQDLQNTSYAQSDPAVIPYQLQAYVGQAVRRGEVYIGSLCVVYGTPVVPTEAEQKLMGIIAGAIGVEEERAAAATSERQKSQELERTLHELQQTQMQLIQTEKMSSLGQLVAGVAHEINNPVGFVSGNLSHANDYIRDLLGLVQLYQQQYPQPTPEIQEEAESIDLEFLIEDLPKLVDSMKMGAHRINEIVQTLKNFSRLDEAKMKPVDIHEGIDSTLLILHNRMKAKGQYPDIRAIKEYGNLPQVECYAGQLNQVFMNILANAIDALEENNELRSVKGENDLPNPSPFIRIRTVAHCDSIAIQISDNGPGIPEEIRHKLFDPFFTTKPTGKGTGLGLSISYQIIVEKHGGQLRCISEPGQGTEFIIELPICQPA